MVLTFLDKVLCATAIFIFWRWRKHSQAMAKSKGFPLPPGPPQKLIIGNLLDIPRERAWHEFLKWRRAYGDIVYAEALGNGILLLNTIEAINDLLDKRPNVYSDRPTFVMVGELMGLDQSIPMLQHGPAWRQQRKLTHISLSPEAVKKYHTVQEDITAMYLDSLIEDPKDFVSQLRLTAGRIIMSVTYGLPVHTPDDLYISEAEETMVMIGEATVPGAFLVDLIPSLRYLPSWLPFNKIHQTGLAGRQQIENMVTRPFEHVKRDIASGLARPSFTLDSLEAVDAEDSGASKEAVEHDIRWAAGAMYGAGGESTYATILSFILAMANYPEVQAKLKEEIDRVVGTGRLPSTRDRPNLPYVNAAIKESLRWRAALPLGIARRAKEDDFYNGYYIPANTIVLPNVWAVAYDEKSGIPSEKFAPERFLSEYVKETATDPYLYAFGFGRRICPGKYLGDNNLFLLISGLMATMDIAKQVGADGKHVDLDPRYTAGLVSHPEPFEAVIVPRSPEAAGLVKERVSRID